MLSYSMGEDRVNVLVVAHGGWLRELLIYLTSLKEYSSNEKYKKEAFRKLSPNTGVSCFEIKLNESGCVNTINCLSLNDTPHLKNATLKDELAI